MIARLQLHSEPKGLNKVKKANFSDEYMYMNATVDIYKVGLSPAIDT